MIKTAKFKIIGMHCSSCVLNIDGEIEDAEGVIKASTSFAKQEVQVNFDPEKIDEPKIREIIAKAGYKAEFLEF